MSIFDQYAQSENDKEQERFAVKGSAAPRNTKRDAPEFAYWVTCQWCGYTGARTTNKVEARKHLVAHRSQDGHRKHRAKLQRDRVR